MVVVARTGGRPEYGLHCPHCMHCPHGDFMTQRKQNPGMAPVSPTISVRVPQEVAEYLRERARRERRTLSQTVALVLADYVAAQQAAAAKPPKGAKKS